MRGPGRGALIAAVLVVLAAGIVLALRPRGHDDPGPAPSSTAPRTTATIAVSPPAVADGQAVTVTGSGFLAGVDVSVVQCRDAGARTGAEDCALDRATIATAGPDGSLRATVVIVATPVPGMPPCTTPPGCVVRATSADGEQVAATRVGLTG